jgi:hypothetical protein
MTARRTPANDRAEQLERAVDELLRAQPLRPAPRDLHSRVLAQIERRAAQPWWRKDFSQWPHAARAAFLIIGSALVRFVWVAVDRLGADVSPRSELAVLDEHATLLQTLGQVIESVARNIPGAWIYGTAALVAVLYVAVFGISAAAYRALYAPR